MFLIGVLEGTLFGHWQKVVQTNLSTCQCFLMVTHRCLDNTSELVLDSATIVTGPDHDRRDSMGTTSRLIDIKDLRGKANSFTN